MRATLRATGCLNGLFRPAAAGLARSLRPESLVWHFAARVRHYKSGWPHRSSSPRRRGPVRRGSRCGKELLLLRPEGAWPATLDRFLPLEFPVRDIGDIPPRPYPSSKAGPIGGDNAHSVLMNLDKLRHFSSSSSCRPAPLRDKKPMGLFGAERPPTTKKSDTRLWAAPWRAARPSTRLHHGAPLPTASGIAALVLSAEQLPITATLISEEASTSHQCEMDLCVELALASLPQPNFETWFMEGRHCGSPAVHYCGASALTGRDPRLRFLAHYENHNDEPRAAIIANPQPHFPPVPRDRASERLPSRWLGSLQNISR